MNTSVFVLCNIFLNLEKANEEKLSPFSSNELFHHWGLFSLILIFLLYLIIHFLIICCHFLRQAMLFLASLQ